MMIRLLQKAIEWHPKSQHKLPCFVERRSYIRLPLYALLIIVCTNTYSLFSQSIRIVRTDVDFGRSGFVTATQMFGIDIVIDSVPNCTGVSFELKYSNAQYITFSNYKARDFGINGTFAIDISDTVSGAGSINIVSLLGTNDTTISVDNPIVIHLDFVVRPNAPNNLRGLFDIVGARAVSFDSSGKSIQLSDSVYSYIIHGFIRVYPGDANNDGVVNIDDGSQVALYFGQGSGTSNVRGYRRDPASTLWIQQESLVWDSTAATYADCDGSGDITLSDNMVVALNFGLRSSGVQRTADQIEKNQSMVLFAPEKPNQQYYTHIYTFYSNEGLTALGTQIRYSDTNGEMHSARLGVEQSECITWHNNDVTSLLTTVLRPTTFNTKLQNPSLLLRTTSPIPPAVESAMGITTNGTIVPLYAMYSSTTTVDELSEESTTHLYPNPTNENITIQTSLEPHMSMACVDIFGQVLYSAPIERTHTILNTASYPTGVYRVLLYKNSTLFSTAKFILQR